MSVDAADGALGIEAVHEWIDIGAAESLVKLGLITDDVATEAEDAWPHYRIADIAGLFDLPEIEDNSERKTESIGLVPYPTRPGGKNVTYTVEVRGRSLQELRAGGAALRLAFGPDLATGLVLERLMVISPTTTYGTQQHAFRARCLQLVQGSDVPPVGPNAAPTPWVRSVVIGLRLYDPRIYQYGEAEGPLGVGHAKW